MSADPGLGQAVAIVGGSLGGLRAAEQLRSLGHAGPITVYEAEPHPAYNRPPLSKAMLAHEDRPDAAAMHAQLAYRRRASVADVDFRPGTAVTSADLAARSLAWSAGGASGEDAFDGLVIASGLRSARLGVPGPAAGRFAIRTIEDVVALRAALAD
ncbi:MAG: FAD-dependent oxidoreductase, partial [Nocardioides sp.]